MGCDIHAVIDYRRDSGAPWQRYTPADNEVVPVIGGRDYRVFALLGNSWNLDELPAIDSPRGLPDDFTPGNQPWTSLSEQYVYDPSWVSLADLEQFDWNQTVSGWLLLDEHEYLDWRDGRRGMPESGCRGVGARRPVLNEAEYRNAEASGTIDRSRGKVMVRVVWTETLRDVVPNLAVDLPAFLGGLGRPNDVRLVYGFNG